MTSIIRQGWATRIAAETRPNIGKGWWLTPEGKKIGVYDHYETTPGMARQMIRPHMAETGQVRVRSFNNQLNVQTSRPFTDAQRHSLLRDADGHAKVFMDVLHPDTGESIHSESGDAIEAERLLTRAHHVAIPQTSHLSLAAIEKPYYHVSHARNDESIQSNGLYPSETDDPEDEAWDTPTDHSVNYLSHNMAEAHLWAGQVANSEQRYPRRRGLNTPVTVWAVDKHHVQDPQRNLADWRDRTIHETTTSHHIPPEAMHRAADLTLNPDGDVIGAKHHGRHKAPVQSLEASMYDWEASAPTPVPCRACGRLLRAPESVAAGVGPVCGSH